MALRPMNKGYDEAPHFDASFIVPFICMGTVIRLFFLSPSPSLAFPLWRVPFSQLHASNLIKRVFCMCNCQTILKQAFHQSYWFLGIPGLPLFTPLLAFCPSVLSGFTWDRHFSTTAMNLNWQFFNCFVMNAREKKHYSSYGHMLGRYRIWVH